MINGHVIIFLVLATLFAGVHQVAVSASLYWYYWWFDIVMHFWGGLLIGSGLHALSVLKSLNFKPTTGLVLMVLASMTITWEVFEWLVGLFDPRLNLLDMFKDLFFGFSGGLIAHFVLARYRRESI